MNILLTIAALLLAPTPAPSPAPETILHNARVFTADSTRAWAGAFAVKDGRIVPGLLADFVVLSRDITKGAPKDILSTRVLLRVMGGKDTYRAKGFTLGAAPADRR